MKFEDGNIIVYTKDEYYEKYGKNNFDWNEINEYHYKGYVVHREDGPAIEYSDGTKCWFKDGKPHREDGPVIEYPNGNKYWYLNNSLYSDKMYNQIMNIKRGKEILKNINL